MNWAPLAEAALRINNVSQVKAIYGTEGRAKHVLVVPVYNESIEDVAALRASVQDDGVRVILVVNESEISSPEGIAQNARLVEEFADWSSAKVLLTVLHLELHKHVGVGGARFAGCEVACALQDFGFVESLLLHNTDADSQLPKGFFDETEAATRPGTSMVMHSLGHPADEPPEQLEAASLFISNTRLTLLNWSAMKSPWAFGTTGCGMSFTRWAYDEVGRWPQISMAEDIYIAGYLAKVGRIQRMPHLRVLTSSRCSSRTLPRPGESEEGAGHGAHLGDVAKGLRRIAAHEKGVEIVAPGPRAVNTCRVVYELIWGYLEGRYVGDQIRAAEVAAKALGVDVDPVMVDDVICDVIGSLPMSVGPAGPERDVRFFSIFDQELQTRLIDTICTHVDREPVETCINESMWGLKHEGSWYETAQKLAALEEKHCCSDVGIGSLEGWSL